MLQTGFAMYHHVKKLMFTVLVDEPNPHFMLSNNLEVRTASCRRKAEYSIQGLNCEDAERKNPLMDIGTEELSHLEVVGTLAPLHLAPTKFDRKQRGSFEAPSIASSALYACSSI